MKACNENSLSPLFVDTEFVPAKLHYLTLFNLSASPVPTVLPYDGDEISFGELEQKISRIVPTSLTHILEGPEPSLDNSLNSVREFKFKAGKHRIDGEEIVWRGEGEVDVEKALAGREVEGSQRCDLCCIMLANKRDVIHLTLEWVSEEATRLKVLEEINAKYGVELGKSDLQFQRLAFDCRTEDGLTNIRYLPKGVSSLRDIVFHSDGLAFVGINVISNRFSAANFVKPPPASQPTQRIIEVFVNEVECYRFDFEMIKQYRTRELLSIFSVKDPESKGLRIMGKIYEPAHLLQDLETAYAATPMINHLTAEIANEFEVFLEGVIRFPPLTLAEIRKIVEESERVERENCSTVGSMTKQKSKGMKGMEMSPLWLFNSECKVHSNRQTSFKLLYHIIHRFIRNYFTHFNSFFDDSVSCRLVHGLLEQLETLPIFQGETWRKVGYELDYQVGEVITLNNFIITSKSTQYLQMQSYAKPRKETYLKIFSETGREVAQHTSFLQLEEVIFQPFTKFTVINRLEDEGIVYLTLTELIQPPRQRRTNVVLWVDDKMQEGRTMFKHIKNFESSVYLYQLASTAELNHWINANPHLLADPSAHIIMITNMRRMEGGQENNVAGIEAVALAQQLIPKCSIIFYIGNIENTKNNLIKNKINPESVFITNNANQLLFQLKQEFTQSTKNAKDAESEKIEKQQLMEYLNYIEHQSNIPFQLIKEFPAQSMQIPAKPASHEKKAKPMIINTAKFQLQKKEKLHLPLIGKAEESKVKKEKEKAASMMLGDDEDELHTMQLNLLSGFQISKKKTDDVV